MSECDQGQQDAHGPHRAEYSNAGPKTADQASGHSLEVAKSSMPLPPDTDSAAHQTPVFVRRSEVPLRSGQPSPADLLDSARSCLAARAVTAFLAASC